MTERFLLRIVKEVHFHGVTLNAEKQRRNLQSDVSWLRNQEDLAFTSLQIGRIVGNDVQSSSWRNGKSSSPFPERMHCPLPSAVHDPDIVLQVSVQKGKCVLYASELLTHFEESTECLWILPTDRV